MSGMRGDVLEHPASKRAARNVSWNVNVNVKLKAVNGLRT